MTQEYDAIIIGAGPAGSTAARILAENGKNVALLEKREVRQSDKVCGGMLPLSDFKEFGISDTSIEKIMSKEVSIYPWMRREIYHPVVTVQRTIFDETLVNAAKSVGANHIMGCRALNSYRTSSGKVLVETLINGSKETLAGRIVIFCDGVNTIAKRTMNIGISKNANRMMFGLVYHFSFPANQMNEYYIFFNPEGITKCGYVWVFPNSSMLNVGVYLFMDELRNHPFKQNLLESYIASYDTELAKLLRGKPIQKKFGAYIPIKPANRFSSDQALVAGDAAGLASAITGGGIHYALFSGRMAGKRACKALDEGNTCSSNLVEYKKSLSGIHKQLLKEYRIFRLCRLGTMLDDYHYPRIFHLYKNRLKFSFINNVRVAAYPLFGKIDI
jgi:geranylgeranyl reductase family protein